MKKIGILTFQNADNYGALLQAYSLKQILKNQGHNVHVLNYLCSTVEQSYRLVKWPKFHPKDIVRQVVFGVMSPYKLYIRSRFSHFRKQYLQDTLPLLPQQLPNLTARYDLFISGSDQVFNPRITNFDTNYFLAFNKDTSKNFSYAASFGLQLENLSEKERNFLKQNLAHFNCISVREKQGTLIVKELSTQQALVHLDPTLLLTRQAWAALATPMAYKGDYVLLYLMHKDKELIEFAQKLAQAKGIRLRYICTSLDLKARVPAKHVTPTPQEWLGLFLNAQYVVTNSFHGFAFSVNFNKAFFLGKLPAAWPVNSRLDNLLDMTGLHNRLYTRFTTNYDESIDWASVNTKLDQERQKSLSYLQEITK